MLLVMCHIITSKALLETTAEKLLLASAEELLLQGKGSSPRMLCVLWVSSRALQQCHTELNPALTMLFSTKLQSQKLWWDSIPTTT